MEHQITFLILGIFASVTSGGLVLSQVSFFWRTLKEKSTTEKLEKFQPVTNWVAHVLWAIYVAILLGRPEDEVVINMAPSTLLRLQFLFYISASAIALEVMCIFIFIIHTTTKNLIILVVSFGALIVSIVTLIFVLKGCKDKSIILGSIVVVSQIITYAPTLFVIIDVYKTKNVESLSFWFCLTSFLNALVWFIYACLPTFDPYLAIVNGIGTLLGIIQLGCLHRFRQLNCIRQPQGVEIV